MVPGAAIAIVVYYCISLNRVTSLVVKYDVKHIASAIK